jgi:dTDP-4-dehydrorhamnose reductase
MPQYRQKILIIGATGMLGQSLMLSFSDLGYEVTGTSREDSGFSLDITKIEQVRHALRIIKPDVVVNAAGIADVDYCERNPDVAFEVNFSAVCRLAEECEANGVKFVQISTDHFFTGDKNLAHTESALKTIVNVYAESKSAAEECLKERKDVLVVRTNITGFRGGSKPTFIEWALAALRNDTSIQGFVDYYTSTIDTLSFSNALVRLVELGAAGIINLASSEVSSKYQFLVTLKDALPDASAEIQQAHIGNLQVKRAESAGLDVSKAEQFLGYKLPGRKEVVANLIEQENKPVMARVLKNEV